MTLSSTYTFFSEHGYGIQGIQHKWIQVCTIMMRITTYIYKGTRMHRRDKTEACWKYIEFMNYEIQIHLKRIAECRLVHFAHWTIDEKKAITRWTIFMHEDYQYKSVSVRCLLSLCTFPSQSFISESSILYLSDLLSEIHKEKKTTSTILQAKNRSILYFK